MSARSPKQEVEADENFVSGISGYGSRDKEKRNEIDAKLKNETAGTYKILAGTDPGISYTIKINVNSQIKDFDLLAGKGKFVISGMTDQKAAEPNSNQFKIQQSSLEDAIKELKSSLDIAPRRKP